MPNSYTFELPHCDSIEIQAQIWCDINAKSIEAGHGIFMEFNDMPIFEKLLKQYFVNTLGWTLVPIAIGNENTFVRKPEN